MGLSPAPGSDDSAPAPAAPEARPAAPTNDLGEDEARDLEEALDSMGLSPASGPADGTIPPSANFDPPTPRAPGSQELSEALEGLGLERLQEGVETQGPGSGPSARLDDDPASGPSSVAPPSNLDQELAAILGGGATEGPTGDAQDPAATKEPPPAPDLRTAQDPAATKEPPPALDLRTVQDPSATKEPPPALDLRTVQDPSATREPPPALDLRTAQDPAATKEPPPALDLRTAQDPAATKEPPPALDLRTVQDPSATKEPPPALDLRTAQDPAATKEPPPALDLRTVQDPAATDPLPIQAPAPVEEVEQETPPRPEAEALEEAVGKEPVTGPFSGQFEVIVRPLLGSGSLGRFWTVLENTVGLGNVVTTSRLRDRSGVQFSIDVGKETVLFEELVANLPGADVVPESQAQISITLPENW